ncbi:MAG: ATP synthase F0 subunit B [Candidatus Handelsmanbacteria bacterium RIFCSPLOWO2_12_FULL_64_10]|uniref:ATP synthase subunit b n=1 Tax=Handelsmanbacteria sp. (strain RIFCSPLOWO2_12_FULL_64_10) TaxID=1817868 RepID=A0A1F6C5F4_HANXR|nr:MAG: ATP synthase F0 subunit B [Candidatus Handelsmanbacteria bacterium RIFCSPLOWO2_12_FULL_64_10]
MLLKVDPGLMIWTIITFVALLIVLKAAVWKPLLAMLDERERRIRDALSGAERARHEAERTLVEYKETLSNAEVEARERIQRATEQAHQERERIVSESHHQATRLVEDAKAEIQHEKERALQELRQTVGDLAIQAASKLLDENLDNARNRKIVDDFIRKLPESSKN